MSDLPISQNFFSLTYSKSESYFKFYLNIGGSKNCTLGPFQLISYNQNKPSNKFSGSDNQRQRMESCSLLYLPQAKFPNNATEIKLQQFDKSDYVDLNVFNNDLYFKVRKCIHSYFSLAMFKIGFFPFLVEKISSKFAWNDNNIQSPMRGEDRECTKNDLPNNMPSRKGSWNMVCR